MFLPAYLRRSKTLSHHLCIRIFNRPMGGGPRTFPGGLNKWQWKRLHEKKAKEKEKRLLDQEKQIYQARIRSEIRAELAGGAGRDSRSDANSTNYSPMSPKDQIKALADRFMKPGAVDLWNEKDGPLKSEEESRMINSPIDVKKLISDHRNPAGRGENLSFRSGIGSFQAKRSYSVQSRGEFKRNESSCSEDESDSKSDGDQVKASDSRLLVKDTENAKAKRFNKFVDSKRRFLSQKKSRFDDSSSDYDTGEDEDEDEDEGDNAGIGGWKDVKKLGSSASLGKYDMKITKRVPVKDLEKEMDFSEEVKLLRMELNKKKLKENEEQKSVEEQQPLYSNKRFDESGVSPLTVKALSAARYFQMTRVQEATLSAFFEGKDALVKARTGTGKSVAFMF